MKKETIPIAVGALILGFILGIAFPKLFPDKKAVTGYQGAPPQTGNNKQSPPGGYGQSEVISRKQREHAIKEYEKLLEKNPRDKTAILGLANMYFDADRYPEAINYYRKYLAIDPANNNAKVDLAVMYRRSGKSDQAVSLLNEVIKNDSRHLIAKMNLGIILHYDLKDSEKAIKVWQDFLKAAPDHPQAKAVKGLIEEARKKIAAIPQLPEKTVN
ncbi:MAG: tetratricopeptide repeat protein [bacterium]